ncbi:unnamed protein product [Pedinophyceae sp. YPF-701]|nr:unnamed protein product [Pedinophyceae sp. YPF-701]
MASSFYDLKAKDINGGDVDFSSLKGNVCVVVNVASACGYTDRNYKQLSSMLDKYGSQGLKVLAFPCNQFGRQEPGSAAEICKFVAGYKFDGMMMEKCDVNGPQTHPVWSFLKQATNTADQDVKWNFACKFLVAKDGSVVARESGDPSTFEGKVQELLKA